MSGIAGLVRFDGRSVRPSEVRGMHEAISHRGPDGFGEWSDQNVGLAHRALHTTRESTFESQPIRHREAGLTLVADARIDNRPELISELAPRANHGSVITDPDLIIASYQKWGVDCPLHLVGAFAFAIWDEPKQRLLLACDHMAIRTLFYYKSANFFAFGTEIKSLFSINEVPRRTNKAVVADHLTTVARREPHATFYENIYQLPGAHCLAVSRDIFDNRRYWALDPHNQLQLGSDDEYIEAFAACFQESVQCRLRSTRPVASALSGGLDSSSIACTARDAMLDKGASIRTLSCIFPGLSEKDLELVDERSYVNAVTTTDGVEDHYVYADQSSPMVDIDAFLRYTDDGFWPGNMYLHWLMFGKAQELDIRVFLDGNDGDSTVSHGYEYLRELIHAQSWDEYGRQVRAIASVRAVAPDQLARRFSYSELARYAKNHQLVAFSRAVRVLNNRFNIPYREMLMGPGLRSVLPEGWHDTLNKIRGSDDNPHDARESLIHPDFAASQDIQNRLNRRYLTPNGTCNQDPSNHRIAHANGLLDPQFMHALNLGDKAGAAHEVEPRYPFFDRRLMEFCVALPGHLKLNNGWDRYVMRKALENVLPLSIQWRTDKARLGANLARNFWAHENERINEMLTGGRSLIGSYVNMPALEGRVEKCRAESDNRARLNGTMEVMGPFMLWRWLEKERSQRR